MACIDVDYREPGAVAACLTFSAFTDEKASGEYVAAIPQVEPYQPGAFYRRELPCILRVLEQLAEPPRVLVIDGFVWLGPDRPGLGARLYQALGERVPILGVAKTKFAGAEPLQEVLRGESRLPLLVSAIGLDLEVAVEHIRSMHGEHRIPTLLKRVDRLCRSGWDPHS